MNIVEKSLKSLEFDKILLNLSAHAKIEQSKSLCLNLKPLKDISTIKEQLAYTKEAKYLLDSGNELPIEYVCDINSIMNSTINSYLKEEEILDIAKTLKSSRLIKTFLKQNLDADSLLNLLCINIYSDKDFEDRIFETFDENTKVKPTASEELNNLYNSLKDNEKNLKTKVNNLLNSPDFSKHLQEQIYTTRDERIVFQVRSSSKSKVPGIIHDVSATNQTFYIEPSQLVPLNNKIREIKNKIYAEIINILTELTKEIRKNIEQLALNEKILANIDFHFSKARYAIKLNAVEPELASEKTIEIQKMRHPLLSDYVENVVENDFLIGKDYHSIIITGSNTGGKTVAIKTVGLFLLMTKSGMFLPCLHAKIYPFDKILADIGDEQSIAQSLSTFSSHLKNIIDILNESDENSFVVIDEICAGTDPQEGSILAQVILEKLAEKNVKSCITTHYGELKTLEYTNKYFKNASVEFDKESLRPTYKLVIGIPGLSNAILICSNLGLEKELIEKSKTILTSHKDPSIIVVEKLQETQQQLSQNLKETEVAKESSQKTKDEYEKKLSELKKEKKKTLKNIKDKLENELENTKQEIKDILNELRQEKSEKIARRSYARLAKLEKQFREDLQYFDDKEKYEEIDWTKIKSGDKVLLKDLHQEVTVLSEPDKNENVTVQMGLIKTKIKKDKLTYYDKTLVKKNTTKLRPKETFNYQYSSLSSTLDLRGYRVEEALDSLEAYLDKASLTNLTPVKIIHGHGTGALKSAIRDFLDTSPYVAKYRIAENSEGGDGACIIDIN